MNTTFSNLPTETRQELTNQAIEGLKDRGAGMYGCDVHNTLFNEDYYIIGRYQAEQWLVKNVGIFSAIETIKEYEQDNYGQAITDLSEAEKVLNMFVYIVGEELLNESDTLQERWNNKLTDEDIESICSELEQL